MPTVVPLYIVRVHRHLFYFISAR